MKSKSLFASILTGLSMLVIVPMAAHANQNVPQELPSRQLGSPEPARINTLVVAGEQDGCTNPAYPRVSSLDVREGTVKLRYTVDQQGKAKDADIVRSSGSILVDNASLNALRKCSFPTQAQQEQQSAAPAYREVVYVWSRD